MTWASRRRVLYVLGVAAFFGIFIGIPTALFLYEPPTCFDGKQNQEEVAPDVGGPCPLLDTQAVTAPLIMWSRAFIVRDGIYNAVAYIENPNEDAGVLRAPYHFKLYDEAGILVAERTNVASIAPASITPIFEGNIETGFRPAAHAFFEFTGPLTWERLRNVAKDIDIKNTAVTSLDGSPRVSASVINTSVAPVRELIIMAVVFDPAGNAFAASHTAVARLEGGTQEDVVLSWPKPFHAQVGRVDVLPLLEPERI
ncbi:MAG TPA: hypothetical protein VJH33_03770 [Candidatus Paceibacterota bacterium]